MMRGQEMAVFKLLIGAVFAVALLAIVHSAVSNIGCPYSGFEEVRNLVLQASRAPNKCFQRESMCFDSGTIISKRALEANLPGISVSASGNARGLNSNSWHSGFEFESKISIPVKVQCVTSSSCTVTFNSFC